MIYEGANGIQALDLVGRKLWANDMRALNAFFADIDDYVSAHSGEERLADFVAALRTGREQIQEGVSWLMENGLSNPDNAGAASTDFMHLLGIVSLTYMWALMIEKAGERLDGDGASDPYYQTKIKTGRYFLDRVVPDAAAHLAKLKSGAASMMALAEDEFLTAH